MAPDRSHPATMAHQRGAHRPPPHTNIRPGWHPRRHHPRQPRRTPLPGHDELSSQQVPQAGGAGSRNPHGPPPLRAAFDQNTPPSPRPRIVVISSLDPALGELRAIPGICSQRSRAVRRGISRFGWRGRGRPGERLGVGRSRCATPPYRSQCGRSQCRRNLCGPNRPNHRWSRTRRRTATGRIAAAVSVSATWCRPLRMQGGSAPLTARAGFEGGLRAVLSAHRGWLVHEVDRGLVAAGMNHGSFGIDLQ